MSEIKERLYDPSEFDGVAPEVIVDKIHASASDVIIISLAADELGVAALSLISRLPGGIVGLFHGDRAIIGYEDKVEAFRRSMG